MLAITAATRVRMVARHLAPAAQQAARSQRQSVTTLHSALLRPSACASFSTSRLSAPLLPPQSERDRGRLTVVLDMDETLLHSHLAPLPTSDQDPRSADDHEDQRAAHIQDKKAVDFTFEIGTGKFDKELVRSTLRPGLREFLHALSEEFEPILFTSAMEIYASPLLDRIDPKPSSSGEGTPEALHPLWRHRIYRPGTVTLGTFSYVKDVSRLGRPMERVVLIDNSWAACVANPDNAIVVPDYLGQKDDDILARVLAMLRQLKDEKDVRPHLIRTIKLRQALAQANIKLP